MDKETRKKPNPSWFKGAPGPGRKKGVPNKATLELKAFTDSLLADPNYQKNVIARVMAGEADHIERFMWEHRFGKPKEQIEVSGTVQHEYRERFNSVLADPELRDIALAFANRLSGVDQRRGANGNGVGTA